MFSFLKRQKKEKVPPARFISVDIHSHLIPGIDDGAETLEESVAMLKTFADMGYKKLVTTPHIMGDFYKNTPQNIGEGLQKLQEIVAKENIPLQLEAAAEYYLDEFFLRDLKKEKQFLCFGERYLLFEMSYMNRPRILEDAIFTLLSQGYQPVLAHPERYTFFFGDFEGLVKLKEKGVLFQINTNSLGGYYSGMSQKLAEQLVDHKMVDFIGSDCHKPRHLQVLQKVRQLPYYAKATHLSIKNQTLLTEQ